MPASMSDCVATGWVIICKAVMNGLYVYYKHSRKRKRSIVDLVFSDFVHLAQQLYLSIAWVAVTSAHILI